MACRGFPGNHASTPHYCSRFCFARPTCTRIRANYPLQGKTGRFSGAGQHCWSKRRCAARTGAVSECELVHCSFSSGPVSPVARPTSHRNAPPINLSPVQNRFGIGSKSVRNRFEIGSKSVRIGDRFGIGSKSVRNRFEIGSKSVRNRFEIGSKSPRANFAPEPKTN